MELAKKEFDGFKLIKSYTIGSRTYWELSRILEDIIIRCSPDISRASRKLLPVEMRLIITKHLNTYRLETVEFRGHPSQFWHPHIGVNSGFNEICWGNARMVWRSKSLKRMLDRNTSVAIGLLTDFRSHGFHDASEILDTYTVPVYKKGVNFLRGMRIQTLPERFWVRR